MPVKTPFRSGEGVMMARRGDLVKMAKRGEFDVILHGCNCWCEMGAGIAKAIRQGFPEAYQADLATTPGDWSKLGTCTVASSPVEGSEVDVVNAYIQVTIQHLPKPKW
jgi:O-acetyl-ADP-ribose deacetylase (regulator of RNase III)